MSLLTADQALEAALLYEEHEWPLSDLAEHFRCSENAVATALRNLNVPTRARGDAPKPLRMKQCAACLHFLPVAMFSGRTRERKALASWCHDCTNKPKPKAWETDHAPLVQAITKWRPTCKT